jgi:hypothetical protein
VSGEIKSLTTSMSDEPSPAKATGRGSWLQISLRTLLAFVLGFGAGLAVRYQFGAEPSRLPNPSGIRLGDKLTVEVGPGLNVPESKRTALVLVDGTISLPKLGQVSVAGLSLEELTADLKQRYEAHYSKLHKSFSVPVFVSFADSSVRDR